MNDFLGPCRVCGRHEQMPEFCEGGLSGIECQFCGLLIHGEPVTYERGPIGPRVEAAVISAWQTFRPHSPHATLLEVHTPIDGVEGGAVFITTRMLMLNRARLMGTQV